MEIEKLKAKAYDLLAIREQVEKELRDTNNQILKLIQEQNNDGKTKNIPEPSKGTAK